MSPCPKISDTTLTGLFVAIPKKLKTHPTKIGCMFFSNLYNLLRSNDMSFLSKLKDILKVGEKVAPTVVTAINPAAGAITGLILNAVAKAEQTGASGADKKKQVVAEVLPSVAPVVNAVLASSGAKVNLDTAGVTSGVGQIVDGVVSLLNSMQAPAAAATGTGGTPLPKA
jgi:hypothetical protein